MIAEYSIEKLLAKQKKIKMVTANLIWEEFVKWAYYIFESERHIAFGKIGNYGYKI